MISSILFGLSRVITLVLNLAMVAIFLSVLVNLLNADPSNPYVRMIHSVTEPMIRPFRKFSARIQGPIDFAPMIVLLVIIFLLEVIPRYLITLANQM